MCGITGFAGTLRQHGDGAVLGAMNDRLQHRGPDGEGRFLDEQVGLAMRRLAIIDVAGGDQPIFNEDRSVAVVLNGEIYNFLELRAELVARGHTFATRADTEVIVHLYEEQGVACVERLWGMFALALWDTRRQRLLVARDRLGKKPLVYHQTADGAGLAFASELQALLAHPGVPREIDPVSIDDFLTYLYVPAPNTIYREVKKLPPGHRLVWQPGAMARVEPYWQLHFTPKVALSDDEAVAEFRTLFRDAVRRRLISDVPLGAFLSGGMDSSSVVAEMAELSSAPVKTFSIGFGEQDFNELHFARQVAQRYGTDHHEMVVEPHALEILPTLVRHYGEPYGDSSAVPTYYVSQMTRQHVTVALNGDGGDEILAGYERHWAAVQAATLDRIPAALRQHVLRPLVPLIPEPRQRRAILRRAKRFLAVGHLSPEERYQRWVGAFTPEQKRAMYTNTFREQVAGNDPVHWIREAMAEPGLSTLDRVLRADTLTYLPNDLLVKVDIASMASSLEARSPFLDHRLVEFAAGLPTEMKLRGRTSKWLMREAMRDRLPPDILTRPKMGFGVPVGEWLRGELRPLLEDTVLSERAFSRGFFKPAAIRSLVQDHIDRRVDRTYHVWGLLMLELWFQEVGDRSAARASESLAVLAG